MIMMMMMIMMTMMMIMMMIVFPREVLMMGRVRQFSPDQPLSPYNLHHHQGGERPQFEVNLLPSLIASSPSWCQRHLLDSH